MQLDEFRKICEDNDQLQKVWKMMVETALKVEINELPLALKVYHGKEILKEEKEIVVEYREKFNQAVIVLKDACGSFGIEVPTLYVSEICTL